MTVKDGRVMAKKRRPGMYTKDTRCSRHLTPGAIGVCLAVILASLLVFVPRVVGNSAASEAAINSREPRVTGEAARESNAMAHPFATTDTISIVGFDSVTFALNWAESGDSCFGSYFIQDTTTSSSGPWTTVDTITSVGVTNLYYTPPLTQHLPPTHWFQLVDNAGCGGGSAASNVVKGTLAPEATLSFSDETNSTVHLSWTNSAEYGGWLGLYGYEVDQQTNFGNSVTIATITTESTTSYDVTSFCSNCQTTTGWVEHFHIITVDQCNGCGGNPSYEPVPSNTVTLLTLTTPTAVSDYYEVGTLFQFSTTVTGGDTPYTISWTGLPEGCPSPNERSFTCTPTSAGSFTVTVTVQDSVGHSLTSLPVTTHVNPNPNGSSGGGFGSSASPIGGAATLWTIVAVIALGVVVAAVLLVRRRRKPVTVPGIAPPPGVWTQPPPPP